MLFGSDLRHCTDASLRGINDGQRRHVENASHSRGLGKDVRGLGGTEENRANRDAASSADPKEVVRDVAGILVRHNQKIGFTRQARVGKDAVENPFRERCIAMHLSFDRKIRGHPLDKRKRITHLLCRR